MIPRVAHRIWLGSPIPDEAERFWAEWQRLHPGWAFETWTDDRLPYLRNARLYDKPATSGNVWQFRSDLVRYELLEQFGGVYVDCDVEPRRRLDELLGEDVRCFAGWEQQDVWIGNAIIGALPGHRFVRALVDGLSASVAALSHRRPNHSTGPRYLTRTHAMRPDELTVFAQDLFYPYSWSQLDRANNDFPEAFTVHHWNNQRTVRGAL